MNLIDHLLGKDVVFVQRGVYRTATLISVSDDDIPEFMFDFEGEKRCYPCSGWHVDQHGIVCSGYEPFTLVTDFDLIRFIDDQWAPYSAYFGPANDREQQDILYELFRISTDPLLPLRGLPARLPNWHLSISKRLGPGSDWSGMPLATFVRYCPDVEIDLSDPVSLSAHQTREALRAFLRKNTDIKSRCCAILAWGGMFPRNARRAFESWTEQPHKGDSWSHVAEQIADGTLGRREAYKRFTALHSEGVLRGMGPAYYTKLIFFLTEVGGKHTPGYIMDQWTARSIRLLYGNQWPLLDGRYVSKRNTADIYEQFCSLIEELTTLHGFASPEDTEIAIFSNYKGGVWRKYVRQQDPRSEWPHRFRSAAHQNAISIADPVGDAAS